MANLNSGGDYGGPEVAIFTLGGNYGPQVEVLTLGGDYRGREVHSFTFRR